MVVAGPGPIVNQPPTICQKFGDGVLGAVGVAGLGVFPGFPRCKITRGAPLGCTKRTQREVARPPTSTTLLHYPLKKSSCSAVALLNPRYFKNEDNAGRLPEGGGG